MLLKIFILLLGVLACSTSVIWIKSSSIEPLLLSSYRLIGAALLLSPCFFHAAVKLDHGFTRRHLLRCLLPAVLLSLHFITWVWGARMTFAANATLSVNMAPVAMPFVLYLLVREKITRAELLGTLVAMAGVAVLWADSYAYDLSTFWGDIVCMGSMLLFAIYLALGRQNRDFASIWLYVVPVYFIGGLFGLLIAWPSVGLTQPMDARNWIALAGIIAVPTLIGHTLLNWALKHLRGQLVSIVNLAQFIFAAAMGALFLDEIPDAATYLAGSLVIAGAVAVIRASQPDSDGL